MPFAQRLTDLLRQAGRALPAEGSLVRHCRLAAVVLVGSLARDDFRAGGSDVDLLFVHGLGDLPVAEVGARPELRALGRHFTEALGRAACLLSQPLPLTLDYHLADGDVVRTQPVWADPGRASAELLRHDRCLWLYSFDFLAHAELLWGEDPRPALRAYDPAPYLRLVVEDLRQRLAAASGEARHPAPTAELVSRWRGLAGELMTLLALQHGCRSLRKADVHRVFNTDVPYFPGKDFAASLWAETLYGTVFQERGEWVKRCERFCANGLALLG